MALARRLAAAASLQAIGGVRGMTPVGTAGRGRRRARCRSAGAEEAVPSLRPLRRVATTEPAVAITFDACATRTRSYGFDRPVFELLKRERVPATIFVSGRWVESHPDVMAELAREPLIEFGDHSYEHPHMSRLPAARIEAEIDQTEAALGQYGKRAVAFRPPFGEWSRRLIDVVQNKQLPTVTWDVVSGDPSARTTTAADDPDRGGQGARRLDRRLPHQRPRAQDGRGAARDRARAARARLPVRAGVRADGVARAGAPNRWCSRGACPLPRSTTPLRRYGRAREPSVAARQTRRRRARVAAVARGQAAWIVGIEPWRGLGYREAALGRYLARLARAGDVWVARARGRARAGGSAPPASSWRRTDFCWAASSPCWRSSRTRAGRGWARPGRARRARLRPSGVGFSRLATLTTALRCVSTGGWASAGSAGYPIS